MANTHSTGSGTQGGTHEQHVKAGEQSHKNASGASSSDRGTSGGANTGTQGGTHEQHVKAGQSSHKST